MTLCGRTFPDEPDAEFPGFWPVARALAAVGGCSERGSALTARAADFAPAAGALLRPQSAYIYKHDVSEQAARRAFQFLIRGARPTCRHDLTAAFFALFTQPRRYDLVRSDSPLGTGVLISDSAKLGVHFAVIRDRASAPPQGDTP